MKPLRFALDADMLPRLRLVAELAADPPRNLYLRTPIPLELRIINDQYALAIATNGDRSAYVNIGLKGANASMTMYLDGARLLHVLRMIGKTGQVRVHYRDMGIVIIASGSEMYVPWVAKGAVNYDHLLLGMDDIAWNYGKVDRNALLTALSAYNEPIIKLALGDFLRLSTVNLNNVQVLRMIGRLGPHVVYRVDPAGLVRALRTIPGDSVGVASLGAGRPLELYLEWLNYEIHPVMDVEHELDELA